MIQSSKFRVTNTAKSTNFLTITIQFHHQNNEINLVLAQLSRLLLIYTILQSLKKTLLTSLRMSNCKLLKAACLCHTKDYTHSITTLK